MDSSIDIKTFLEVEREKLFQDKMRFQLAVGNNKVSTITSLSLY